MSSQQREAAGTFGDQRFEPWHTQEQIAEAMNAMQRQIAELASLLAEERHRGASFDGVAQVLDRWTTQQAQQPVARLVDTRGKGRPSNFGSGVEKSLEKSFQVWQRKMQNYIISVFPDLRDPLEWAAMTAVPHHFSTRRTTIPLRSRSHGPSDGPGGQDAPSLCCV